MTAATGVLEAERERAERNRRAWEQVLDRLEADLADTEALLSAPEPLLTAPAPVPWESPALDGPLPDELLPRARDLHQRQTAVREALAAALADTRARRDRIRPSAGSGSTGSTGTRQAAYVDVSA